MKTKFKSSLWAISHSTGQVVCAVAALLLLATSIDSQAQYNYSTLDVPGAANTQIYGISGNNIVGTSWTANQESGFLYNGSTYTSLGGDFPSGISGNNIVGSYATGSGSEGFLYNLSSGTFTSLAVSGAQYTAAYAISGNDIVGYYQYNSSPEHWFLYDGSTYTTLNLPGSPRGIAGNDIVGSYYDGGNEQGYLYDLSSDSYITLSVPGAFATDATGVSGNDVVGFYSSNTSSGGFIYDGSSYTILNFPGAGATVAWGIDGTNIVGYYIGSNGYPNGFLATPVPEPSALGLLAVGVGTLMVRNRHPR